jgi:hypothetical protein
MKINFEDEVQTLLLPISMSDSCNMLVVSVSNSAHAEKLNLEMVRNNMLNEEAINKGGMMPPIAICMWPNPTIE